VLAAKGVDAQPRVSAKACVIWGVRPNPSRLPVGAPGVVAVVASFWANAWVSASPKGPAPQSKVSSVASP
jgi:hypothetical protein